MSVYLHNITNVISQDVTASPSINIDDVVFEVTDHVICSSKKSLDMETDKHTVKAANVMAKLSKHVWDKSLLTLSSKLWLGPVN